VPELRGLEAKGVLPEDVAIRLLEFAALVALALDVYGNREAAIGWLTSAHPLFRGMSPLQAAESERGLDYVRTTLGSLKYGGAV